MCVCVCVYVQTLAINRGESLKILTVKVNIPDRVKSDFFRWCIDCRSEIWSHMIYSESECDWFRNAELRLHSLKKYVTAVIWRDIPITT